MATWIALLRAVNVGGHGKLPMAALRDICAEAGFSDIRTQGASGNAVFATDLPPDAIAAALAVRLEAFAGKPVGVILRTGAEMTAVLAANPFPAAAPKFIQTFFLPGPPPGDTLDAVRGRSDEELRLGAREIYVHYPSGQGRSKLVIPAAREGTARNMNTIARLAEMAAASNR
jgi:uncharacterized protein (DUF1697 family)